MTDATWPSWLPPRYEHTASLLQRAAWPGPIFARATGLWGAVQRRPSAASFVVQERLRGASALKSWERRLVAAFAWSMLRHHRMLQALTGSDDPVVLWRQWLVWQGLPLAEVAAEHPGLLVGADDAAAAGHARLADLPAVEALALAFSLPADLARRLHDSLGAEAWGALDAMQARRPQVLRVFGDRTRVEAELGEQVAAHPDVPTALIVQGRTDVHRWPAWKEGRVEIQDAGSQRMVQACGARPGERWLDLCAGGGGKTMGLAHAVGPGGAVVAHDIRSERLVGLARRMARLGVAERVRTEPDAGGLEGPFDGVLVDAPCTGTGTFGRDATLRMRWDPARLHSLVQTQRTLLQQAARMVRPGGVLVYGTCSLLADENERQAAWFEEQGEGFERLDQARLLPHRDHTDGFFWTVWRRLPAP